MGVACVEEDNEDNNYGDFGAAVQPRPSNADVTSNLEVLQATTAIVEKTVRAFYSPL